MNKRHYEHTLPNIRGSLSNTYNLLWVVGYIIIGLAIIAAVIALINSKLKMSL